MDYLEIKNLSFQYAGNEKQVLDNVSLSINQGDFMLICGASGSGKSTLLKMLKPQLTPAGKRTGDIYLNNEKLTDLPESFSASNIGYVMQNPENQIVTDSVWQELAFGLENMGIASSEMKSRIAEMVNYLGIQELIDFKTKDLSGGQKQLLNLASVLVMRPDILILDEPTTQLDPIASQNFIDILVRLNKEMGLTILLAEHDLEAIFSLANKVVLLDKGQLIFSNKPTTISREIKNKQHDLKRFIASLPSAVQIYLESGLNGKPPLTVLEGKRFLAHHFPKNADDKMEKSNQRRKLDKKEQNISIQIKNGWFRYDKKGRDILAGVDLDLYDGEIFSLVGGNGTGKTTLLKVIAGIHECYRGKIKIFDQTLKKNQQEIGYLPQTPQLMFIKDSVIEDYENHLKTKRIDAQDQIKKITELLDLKGILTQHPLDLSGGESQMAALGKLLLTDPKVLLLDEPTKGIDGYGKKQLIRLLKKLSHQGKTILVVTHDLAFAAELSDRCGLFFQNNVLTTGAPNDFFSHHSFYTTAASRISRETFSGLVTTEQVIAACRDLKGVADE
ncbi:ABC transporter ATP-binding protein [Candidatus Enterococcus ikei]|uniref:ABC transporter ATP-binding protein n=1 Tax=Candidatus Enterococcus ikei TaxID=2815326 RepID=A0ABS3GVM2_9ENTE|nr:energy-coupling factor transporter ATPase [Enterococcus sp. DIV0869a]MBO0439307.1 ABC transporter ATP-binding protein [Enterococcus sp. DIV0869a]